MIDFIDMVLESNRDLVLRRLVECLARDRTKHQVAEVTSLGLVQMTRKRLGLGLLETFSETCEHCQGRGVVVHSEPIGKSKQSGSSEGGGRKRRSSSTKSSTVEPHQITDDARAAIAQIAAKTVGAGTTSDAEDSGEDSQASQGATDDSAVSSGGPAEDVLGLAELAAQKKTRTPRRAKKSTEALDAVLNAFPNLRRRVHRGSVAPRPRE